MRTSDGRPIKVLETGRLNLDGGPDFCEARIRIAGITFTGDVEIHRTLSDWYSHGHQCDPKYNRVILHVVLDDGTRGVLTKTLSGRAVPVLVLSDFLSEPIQSVWHKAILDERALHAATLRCVDKNTIADDAVINGWLRKLAVERLELKLRRFEERLRELLYERLMTVQEHPRTYGEPPVEGSPDEIPIPLKELSVRDYSNKEVWEQVLYEGILEGLGYSKNRDPFLRLARSVTLSKIRELHLADDEMRRGAVLFAVAGLLPKIKMMTERDSKQYVRTLVRAWHDIRSLVRVPKLQPADWQFFPTRPNNFPTLRIAAANALLSKLLNGELFRAIIQAIKTNENAEQCRTHLNGLLSVRPDDFWTHHYDFDQPSAKPIVALGLSRTQEVIVNTVIPIALLYARTFKDSRVRESVLRLYEIFPPMQENSLTRLVQEQLYHSRRSLNSAALQQGAIQLYKYYCVDGRCGECDVGKIVFGCDERQ